MKILLTGIGGFIGFHVASRCLKKGIQVVGIDNFNNYYNPQLKLDRVGSLLQENLTIHSLDVSDYSDVEEIFKKNSGFNQVIHLAAQTGVRHSVENPHVYIKSNINGFFNVLHLCKEFQIPRFIYASTSSVYGDHVPPWSETMCTNIPVSLYGATKIANEVLAQSYFRMFEKNKMIMIGLRFFTVYGPWGRPDMAFWLWTKAVLENQPVILYNFGKSSRSFTYIDDVVDGIEACIDKSNFGVDHFFINLGNPQSWIIEDVVNMIANYLGKKADKLKLPLPIGDVGATTADVHRAERILGFSPSTPLQVGLQKFIDWFVWYKENCKERGVPW